MRNVTYLFILAVESWNSCAKYCSWYGDPASSFGFDCIVTCELTHEVAVVVTVR